MERYVSIVNSVLSRIESPTQQELTIWQSFCDGNAVQLNMRNSRLIVTTQSSNPMMVMDAMFQILHMHYQFRILIGNANWSKLKKRANKIVDRINALLKLDGTHEKVKFTLNKDTRTCRYELVSRNTCIFRLNYET